ncbi:hypothetical protein HDE69_001320 [Pedobacter cryoconitis]|uniref:Carboxypeptidase-like protein n=1 Tax=Pedobacter cryoconitis TaxID=188932 RepID=A0A7W9DIN3_9SPHI|nr:carboxypeptidase-like regulatory domain-containing protein [Pedobacter cryoconitis]MBB5620271.1 hypothetical protein [Pedobacter cryoconitis]
MKKAALILFVNIIINFNTVHGQNAAKIEGVIVDENNITLPYVSIKIGTQTSTITNSEGSFSVKISDAQLKDSLSISYIGYKNFKIPVLKLQTGLKVKLVRNVVNLKEIIIRPVTAESIIANAMKNIPQNYATRPFEMTGFYREVGRVDSNYLSFAEASLNILNQGYTDKDKKDLVVINKERSLKKVGDIEVNNPFHAAVKGVPYIVLENDIVKHPGAIFGNDYLSKYTYQIAGSVIVNGEEAYVIKFDQKDGIKKALYKGTVVIIMSSYAIVSIDFILSPKGKAYAQSDVPFLQRPVMSLLGYSIQKVNEELSEKYMKINDKWYPYFYKIETTHRVKAKKQRIDGNLYISAELFISKINEQPKSNYSKDKVMPDSYVFNKLTDTYSDDYWEGFNFIKPASSLKVIAEKLHSN